MSSIAVAQKTLRSRSGFVVAELVDKLTLEPAKATEGTLEPAKATQGTLEPEAVVVAEPQELRKEHLSHKSYEGTLSRKIH